MSGTGFVYTYIYMNKQRFLGCQTHIFLYLKFGSSCRTSSFWVDASKAPQRSVSDTPKAFLIYISIVVVIVVVVVVVVVAQVALTRSSWDSMDRSQILEWLAFAQGQRERAEIVIQQCLQALSAIAESRPSSNSVAQPEQEQQSEAAEISVGRSEQQEQQSEAQESQPLTPKVPLRPATWS